MDRTELDDHLARLGLPGHVELLARRGSQWTADPWTLVDEVDRDRGAWHRRAMPDEDTWCRTVLLAYLDDPRRVPLPGAGVVEHGWSPTEPGPGLGTGAGTGAPAVLWRRRLSPGCRHLGLPGDTTRDGVLVVLDSGSWWDHGVDGVLLLSALEVDTGAVRWSVPAPDGARGRDSRQCVVPGAVLLHAQARLTCLDPATGLPRWDRAWPVAPLVVGSAGEVLALGSDGHGESVSGLDLATGITRWTAPRRGLRPFPAYERGVPPPCPSVSPGLGLDVATGRWVETAPPGGPGHLAEPPAGLLERQVGRHQVVHRAVGTTLVQRLRRAANGRYDEPDGLLALADGGQVRWSVPGGWARVCGEEVWVTLGEQVTSYDVGSGVVRWTAPRDLGGPAPLSRADLDELAADRARGSAFARLVAGEAVAYR